MEYKMDYIEQYGGRFNNKNDIATNSRPHAKCIYSASGL